MQTINIRGFKHPKSMKFLGDLAIACGAHWRYLDMKQPSYQTTTLEPYTIKQQYYNQIKRAQSIWIKLLIKLSQNLQLIEELHEGLCEDLLIGNILKIARKVLLKNNKVTNFFLIRCDYVFNEARNTFEQTEYNAIAPGTFAVSDGVQTFHKCIQNYRERPSNILIELPKQRIIQVFKQVHKIYEAEYKTQATFLMVAKGNDNDTVQQAQVQKCLILAGISVIKASFQQIDQDMEFNQQSGILKVKGQEIGIIYYRQGFSHKCYDYKNSWQVREKLELSRAISCPNPFIHLLNFKNIQTKLKTTNVMKGVLSEEEVEILSKLQTTLFTIDEVKTKKQEIIKQYGNNLVVKSIHEGTGQNFFKQQAIKKMREMPEESIMVMELIKPTSRPVQVLGQDYQLIEFNAVSELGLFGYAIYKSPKDIQKNEYIGYLIRTTEEGVGLKNQNYKRKAFDALCLV